MGTRDDEYDYLFKGRRKIHLSREYTNSGYDFVVIVSGTVRAVIYLILDL